jgi:glycosyltransferase involved in cell wall biosynthesis
MIFTVVIPLFNKEQYIQTTITSVLQQSYSDFELLVVDDGSTDGSAEIVHNISDPRLKYIKKEHSGAAATRNFGIRRAEGRYIAFLDADDWWAPTFLEEMAGAIAKYPNQKLFATGRTHVFEKKTIPYKNKFLPAVEETALLNHYQVISKQLPAINMSNAVVLKQHIENTGYLKEGMQNHEDHEFWLRLSIGNEIVFINKPLSYYRKNIISQSSGIFRIADFITYLNTCEEVFLKLSKKEQKWFQAYLNRFILLSYLKYSIEYSKKESKMLDTKISKLLNGSYYIAYKSARLFSFINFYNLLRKLNG